MTYIAAAIAPNVLKLSTSFAQSLLETLPPEEQESIARAFAHGARLVVECDPLAERPSVTVVLVEREGARHDVGHVNLKRRTTN